MSAAATVAADSQDSMLPGGAQGDTSTMKNKRQAPTSEPGIEGVHEDWPQWAQVGP